MVAEVYFHLINVPELQFLSQMVSKLLDFISNSTKSNFLPINH